MSRRMLWACLSVVVLMPLSTDIFISGFPEMSEFFSTKHIGLVISFYLAGLAISQPFYGPLFDRLGRKPVLLMGIVIYLLGTLITLITDQYTLFLMARFIQAMGACSLITGVFSIIHDETHDEPHQLSAAMGVLMAMIGSSPAISPLLGSSLIAISNWRVTFYFLFIVGCLYFISILFFFSETQANKNLSALEYKHIWNNYKRVFSNKRFLLFSLTSGLSYGIMFSYLTVSSLFIMITFGFSVMTVGFISLFLGCILFVCSICVPRLVKRIGLAQSALMGTLLLAAGSFLELVAGYIIGSSIYTFIIPILIVVMGVGFVRPVASTGAMLGVEKDVSGSASAGFSFVSFLGGSICSAVVIHFSKSVPIFGGFILGLSLLAILVAWWNSKQTSA